MDYNKKLCGPNATSKEIFVVLKGVEIAFHHDLFPIVIKTFSTEVITLLMKNQDSLFNSFISQCRYWLRKLQNSVIQHNFKEGNTVAHVLANQARTNNTNEVCLVFVTSHAMASHCLAEDVMGHNY